MLLQHWRQLVLHSRETVLKKEWFRNTIIMILWQCWLLTVQSFSKHPDSRLAISWKKISQRIAQTLYLLLGLQIQWKLWHLILRLGWVTWNLDMCYIDQINIQIQIHICLCTQKRTEFQCPICEKGQREVFQPKLVIFRASQALMPSFRTCLPRSQACLDVFLANHPRPFQWPFGVQWTVIFRRKGCAQPGNWTQDLPLSVQML